jgi:hypothetical protein
MSGVTLRLHNVTQRTAMFRPYVKLHGLMDHTFMHNSSWVIRAFTSQGQDEEAQAMRLRCSARSNSSFASCSIALFVKGGLAVCLVFERSSSPLCFVSRSGVSLRCVCECMHLQLTHISLESMILNCVWCH